MHYQIKHSICTVDMTDKKKSNRSVILQFAHKTNQ